MDTSERLFLDILKALDKEGMLQDLVIIGGWSLLIYRHIYGNPSVISSIRTADVDFLVSVNQKFKHNIDIGKIFSEMDFEQVFSLNKGYIKYVHPDMEAEFLVPLVGRQIEKPYIIKALKTNAQRLRFLDILIKYSKRVTYFKMNIKVPEPAAYVINKLIVSTRRSDHLKKEKDLKAAKELGEYVLDDPIQKKLIHIIFNSYSFKIIKNILNLAKAH